MFRSIQNCMAVPLAFLMCEAEYDEEYGYPTRFAIYDFDLSPDIIEVLDFEPMQ
jgi:hypothetical protein